MADLMRMLENYSRQAKQQEDKISGMQQQEELLVKELQVARAANEEKKQELQEAHDRCQETVSELQQKAATIQDVQRTNEGTKQAINNTQQERRQLAEQVRRLRERFISDCMDLDNEALVLLKQLRSHASAMTVAGSVMRLDSEVGVLPMQAAGAGFTQAQHEGALHGVHASGGGFAVDGTTAAGAKQLVAAGYWGSQ